MGYLATRAAQFEYLCLGVSDFGADVGMSRVFDEGFHFIETARSNGGAVFVHCANGSNRSPTIVVAFLMQSEGLRLQDAYRRVLQRRPHIQPLADNQRELARLEARLLAEGSLAEGDTKDPASFEELKRQAKAAFIEALQLNAYRKARRNASDSTVKEEG